MKPLIRGRTKLVIQFMLAILSQEHAEHGEGNLHLLGDLSLPLVNSS